jgi:hypothetical protein
LLLDIFYFMHGMTTMTVDDDDAETTDSADEALCEILGITSLGDVSAEEVNGCLKKKQTLEDVVVGTSDDFIDRYCQGLKEEYESSSFCIFPDELSIPATITRRLTDELVWGGESVQADRTYETITVRKDGDVQVPRRTLTRLENFETHHAGWNDLCSNYIRRCVSAALGVNVTLYKTKLNLKPPGGSGFAPHLDTPSLRVALGDQGPRTFVTVMIAIDSMTVDNGCLRIARGRWNEETAVETIRPEPGGNPDAGGRAGAIPPEVANQLEFEDICCSSGTIVAFSGWAPHRSGPNQSNFPRRAVFLTYNPVAEGDFHEAYYAKMLQLRNDWKAKVGLTSNKVLNEDEQRELNALATIPRI